MALGEARARYMDGSSAEDHAVRVVAEDAHLAIYRVDDGGLVARWPLAGLRVDAMHEGEVAHVESSVAPGALVTVDDALFVTALRLHGAKVREVVVGRRAVVIGSICLAVFAALVGGLYLAAPALSAWAAQRVPPSVERQLSSPVEGLVLGRTCRKPQAEAALRRMMSRLDPEGSTGADVHVVNIAMPNAFALPGGTVLLTRGLVEEAESADEVAGVLAHELGHVRHRHVLAAVLRNTFLGALWAATVGDYSGLLVVDPHTAYNVASLQFSREAEAEADDASLETLTAGRISARGVTAFFERMSRLEVGDTSFLSTHPASKERMDKFASQKLAGAPTPALDPESLYHLRTACEDARRVESLRDLLSPRPEDNHGRP